MKGISVSEQQPLGGAACRAGNQGVDLTRHPRPEFARAHYPYPHPHPSEGFRNGPGAVGRSIVYHRDSKGNTLLCYKRLKAAAKTIFLIPGWNDDVNRTYFVVSFHQNRVIIRG